MSIRHSSVSTPQIGEVILVAGGAGGADSGDSGDNGDSGGSAGSADSTGRDAAGGGFGVAGADALVGVYFLGHWTKPDFAAFGPEVAEEDDALLAEAATQLRQYLAGERREFDVPMALAGTPFQQQVWAMLREVPYGETTTYGALAERLGSRSLARMVGQAVGHNPLSIMVGCHRVVGANGSLTGYAGGLERKEFLLTLEGSALAPSRLF